MINNLNIGIGIGIGIGIVIGNGIGNGIGNETELFGNNYDFFPVPLQLFGLRDQPLLIRFHAS